VIDWALSIYLTLLVVLQSIQSHISQTLLRGLDVNDILPINELTGTGRQKQTEATLTFSAQEQQWLPFCSSTAVSGHQIHGF
jgi:hypothetical protein